MLSIRHPRSMIIAAIVLVVLAAVLAFIIAELVIGDKNTKLKESLENAAIVLIFGAILGGVVKLLLEDLDRGRVRRAEQAQFIVNTLGDLKSVYDQVEHARLLLSAHKSAKTYGEEMRALIPSRVQLLNVIRALDNQTAGLSAPTEKIVKDSVGKMSAYLTLLTEEFRTKYKRIGDLQRTYEAKIDAMLKKVDEKAILQVGDEGFANEAWQEIIQLKMIIDFLTPTKDDRLPQSAERKDAAQPHPSKTRYESEFVESLDEASKYLRIELRKLLGNLT